MRLALFGGCFDPIHHGHLISARAIAEHLSIEKVILVPSARPPHKKSGTHASAEDRLAMARLAVEGDDLYEVSDLELHRDGPSYTIDTVDAFHAKRSGDELFWMIGADSLPELPTWHRVAELVQRVQIVTATRPGWQPPSMGVLAPAVGDPAARLLLDHCVRTPAIEISATDIRRRVAADRSIRYAVPERVREYIEREKLYRIQGSPQANVSRCK